MKTGNWLRFLFKVRLTFPLDFGSPFLYGWRILADKRVQVNWLERKYSITMANCKLEWFC